MKEKKQLELKVGLFLNLGIALVTIAILLVGATRSFFNQRVGYKIVLENAQGLATGAKVLIAGIQAGNVDSLDLSKDDRRVKVHIKVEKKYEDAIRADTQAELTTEGLLGDKVIALNAGDPSKTQVAEGGKIETREGSDFSRVVSKSDVLLTNLNELTMNLNKIAKSLNAPDGELSSLNSVLKRLHSVLAKVDDGRGSIGALINDPALYDDAKRLIGESNNNRIVRNLVRKTVNDSDKKAQEQAQATDKNSPHPNS